MVLNLYACAQDGELERKEEMKHNCAGIDA
jgi:hypothetical protein